MQLKSIYWKQVFHLTLIAKLCSKLLYARTEVWNRKFDRRLIYIYTPGKLPFHAYKMYTKFFLTSLQSTNIGRLENWRAKDSRDAKFTVFFLERVTTSCDKQFWRSFDFNVVPGFPDRVTPVSLDCALLSFTENVLVNSSRLEGFFMLYGIIIIIYAGIISFV